MIETVDDITPLNIPGYITRSFPELDEPIVQLAKEEFIRLKEEEPIRLAELAEFDRKYADNPMAYIMRPSEVSAPGWWMFHMANRVPMIIEFHRHSLGVGRVNEDGSLNPLYKE